VSLIDLLQKKATIASTLEVTTDVQVIICAPVTPILRPNLPALIEPSIGRKSSLRYIVQNINK